MAGRSFIFFGGGGEGKGIGLIRCGRLIWELDKILGDNSDKFLYQKLRFVLDNFSLCPVLW